MAAGWEERAACRRLLHQLIADGVPAVDAQHRVWAMFYPKVPRGGRNPRDPYRAARQVCASCPVARECLNAALAEDEFRGVRAGLDPLQLLDVMGRPQKRIPA